MNVAVFGATGRTGRLVVGKALDAGHRVTAFARDPSKLGASDERLRVVEGDVYDRVRVEEAVAGQDAVVSAVGPVSPRRATCRPRPPRTSSPRWKSTA